MHFFTAQVKKVELSNGCGDSTYDEQGLHFNLPLSSNLHQCQNLQADIHVNFSLIPNIPNNEIWRTNFIIHTIDISNILFHSQWTGGRSVQLNISRVAVPGCVMERIMSSRERFRVQVKLNLVCVDSRAERALNTDVQWLKNGALHMNSTCIRRQRERLIFEEVLVSDEGNWTCSNGSLSPPFKLYGECGT